MTKCKLVCDWCDSENVRADAWAEWDTERQGWKLSELGDYFYCHECGGETSVKEVNIEEAA